VQFSDASQSANENSGPFSIPVTLSAASTLETTIPFGQGGTATPGTNYSLSTTSPLVIPAGQTTGTITGTLLDDGTFTPNNTLVFTLGNPTNGMLGGPTTDTLTINETDPPQATHLVFATQPNNAVPGQLITPAIIVLVEDQFGNVVTTDNSLVTIDLGNNPGASILGGNRAVSAVNGRATFNVLFLTALGSGYNLVATDGSLTRVVSNPFDIDAATLTASTAVALVNQPVTFTFRTFSLAPSNGNPFGTVTFSLSDGTALGTAPVNSDGLATFTTTALPVGFGANGLTVIASYNDPVDATASVAIMPTTNANLPLTIVLGAGDSGTLATLNDGAGPGTVAGTLQTNNPLVGQYAPASDTLVPNFGDDNLFTLAPGSSATALNLVANFTADFAFRRSYSIEVQSDIGLQSGPVTQVFTIFVAPSAPSSPARTTTTLTASVNPASFGQVVSFTASVSGSGGFPTGSFLFLADGNPLGALTVVNGSATFTISTLSLGNHAIAAIYTGDGTFNASTSATLTETVSTLSTPTPTPTSTPTPTPTPVILFSGIGAFDSASGTWYLRNEDSAGAPDAGKFAYGLPGWEGVVGDWNGDGTVTVGVVDPLGVFATWYLRNENSPGGPDVTGGVPFAFGFTNWIPLAGDWTGSGHTGIGMFDPTTNTFYLENDPGSGKVDFLFQYGAPGWIPVVGDWNHSGHDGIGMVDPTTMTWYLRNEVGPGAPDAGQFAYGFPGWRPVTGDWNGDGSTTIGLFDPTHFTWYLRNENNAGAPDAGQFAYGFSSWSPVAGAWTAPSGSSASPASAQGTIPDAAQPSGQEDLLAAVLAVDPGTVRRTRALDAIFSGEA
jgi:hypothetical protein